MSAKSTLAAAPDGFRAGVEIVRTYKNPIMEHRHFETVAAIIRDLGENRAEVAAHFARGLRATNPKFDPDRFIRATEPR